jgi:hypothetical protein
MADVRHLATAQPEIKGPGVQFPAPVKYRSLGQALNPWVQSQKMYCISGDEAVKEGAPIPRHNWCKVR